MQLLNQDHYLDNDHIKLIFLLVRLIYKIQHLFLMLLYSRYIFGCEQGTEAVVLWQPKYESIKLCNRIGLNQNLVNALQLLPTF